MLIETSKTKHQQGKKTCFIKKNRIYKNCRPIMKDITYVKWKYQTENKERKEPNTNMKQ